MIKINLIPKEYMDKIDKSLLIAKVVLVSVIIFALFAVASLGQFSRAKALDIEFDDKTLKYEGLKEEIKKTEDINKKIAEINNYISAIDKITKNRFLYPAFMQDMVNNLPLTMWFMGMNTKTGGERLDINLNLQSNSLYDLAWWVSFLENNPRFESVGVGNITVTEVSGNTVYVTPLTLKYNYK